MDNNLRRTWEQRLAEQKDSGKSIAAWCKEQAVKENQFYYWQKKLRSGPAEKTQPVQWLPMDLQLSNQVNPVSDWITVHIGKASVEIRQGFDHHLLREILHVLQTM